MEKRTLSLSVQSLILSFQSSIIHLLERNRTDETPHFSSQRDRSKQRRWFVFLLFERVYSEGDRDD
jgi:hypothetical protein